MELAKEYSDVVTRIVIGRTVENREIVGLKINYNPSKPKNIGIMQSALHSREWITPAVVTWIVKEFLTSKDPGVRAMAEDLEWHIFPVVNADGYVYTFTDVRI
jgi:murein tripeptide amidase MpaA